MGPRLKWQSLLSVIVWCAFLPAPEGFTVLFPFTSNMGAIYSADSEPSMSVLPVLSLTRYLQADSACNGVNSPGAAITNMLCVFAGNTATAATSEDTAWTNQRFVEFNFTAPRNLTLSSIRVESRRSNTASGGFSMRSTLSNWAEDTFSPAGAGTAVTTAVTTYFADSVWRGASFFKVRLLAFRNNGDRRIYFRNLLFTFFDYCPSAPVTPVLNGAYTSTSRAHGERVTADCDTGYVMNNFTQSCYNGTYLGIVPNCIPRNCSSPPAAVANGVYLDCAQGTRNNTNCTLRCDAGFVQFGREQRCKTNTYVGVAPTCVVKNCTLPPATVENGAYDTGCLTAGARNGTNCTLTCLAGYALVGREPQCRFGVYVGAAPACVARNCTLPPATVVNGAYDAGCVSAGARNGTNCTLTCEPGYAKQGREQLCLLGQYVGSAPTCGASFCTQAPPNPVHGSYAGCAGVGVGQPCALTCDDGYALWGSAQTCVVGVVWSTLQASCMPKNCSTVPAPVNNGVYTDCVGVGARNGTNCTLRCDPGYAKQGREQPCVLGQYQGSAPSCNASLCTQAPPNPAFGSYPGACAGATVGQPCVLTCTAGYAQWGNHPTCVVHTTWAPLPACMALNCTTPPAAVPNGVYVDCASVGPRNGANCTLACAPGHTRMGVEQVCVLGNYTGEAPRCTATHCTAPPSNPAHGTFAGNCAGTAAGFPCALTCGAGYGKWGPDPTCIVHTTWTESPACMELNCTGAPGGLPNGDYAACGAVAVGSACTPACHEGYQLNGSAPVCVLGPAYAPTPLPQCLPHHCTAPPPNPRNGSYPAECAGRLSGASCDVACDLHFTRWGPQPSCVVATQWTVLPACMPNNCSSAPPAVGNGDWLLCLHGTTHGNRCGFQCHSGFGQVGTAPLCELGSYVGELPACGAVACVAPPANPLHGTYDPLACNAAAVGGVCVLNCTAGYTRVGALPQCVGGVVWLGSPTCEPSACAGEPPAVTNGVYSCDGGGTPHGLTCTLACVTGYVRSGGPLPECQFGAFDTAANPAPTCIPSFCTADPSNATASFGGYYGCAGVGVGDACALHCAPGYTAWGADPRCVEAATWSGPSPTCMPNNCTTAPPAPANGSYACTGAFNGASCALDCALGYEKWGMDQACTLGQWLEPAPTCEAVECTIPPEASLGAGVHNALCFDLRTDEWCALECLPGYSLQGGSSLSAHCVGVPPSGAVPESVLVHNAVCLAATCAAPVVSQNRTAGSCDGTQTTGTSCTMGCAAGYGTVQGRDVLCAGTGGPGSGTAALAPPAFTCSPVACEVNTTLGAHETVGDCTEENLGAPGDECTLGCANGYEPEFGSSPVARCVGVGQGLSSLQSNLTCVPKPCLASPPNPAGGFYGFCDFVSTGNPCILTCADGFFKSGSDPLCDRGGYGVLPSCTASSCGLPTLSGAGQQPGNCSALITTGRECVLGCGSGFTADPATSAQLLCEARLNSPNATYAAPTLTCLADNCTLAPALVTGSAASGQFEPRARCAHPGVASGTVCILACNLGYSAQGSPATRCYAGQYNTSDSDCVAATCAPLLAPPGIQTACGSAQTAATCGVSCATGYHGGVPTTAECTGIGVGQSEWRYNLTCLPDPCVSNPADPEGGLFRECAGAADGSVCELVCGPGYYKQGGVGSTCALGTWTHQADCIRECSTPLFAEGGFLNGAHFRGVLPDVPPNTEQIGFVVPNTVEWNGFQGPYASWQVSFEVRHDGSQSVAPLFAKSDYLCTDEQRLEISLHALYLGATALNLTFYSPENGYLTGPAVPPNVWVAIAVTHINTTLHLCANDVCIEFEIQPLAYNVNASRVVGPTGAVLLGVLGALRSTGDDLNCPIFAGELHDVYLCHDCAQSLSSVECSTGLTLSTCQAPRVTQCVLSVCDLPLACPQLETCSAHSTTNRTCACPAPLVGYWDAASGLGSCVNITSLIPTHAGCVSDDYITYYPGQFGDMAHWLVDNITTTGIASSRPLTGQYFMVIFQCVKRANRVRVSCFTNTSCATIDGLHASYYDVTTRSFVPAFTLTGFIQGFFMFLAERTTQDGSTQTFDLSSFPPSPAWMFTVSADTGFEFGVGELVFDVDDGASSSSAAFSSSSDASDASSSSSAAVGVSSATPLDDSSSSSSGSSGAVLPPGASSSSVVPVSSSSVRRSSSSSGPVPPPPSSSSSSSGHRSSSSSSVPRSSSSVPRSSSSSSADHSSSSSSHPWVSSSSSHVASSSSSSALPLSSSSAPPRKFFPAILDHSPFDGGAEYNSNDPSIGTPWPAPFVNEADDVDVMLTPQPPVTAGGTTYFTPEIRPAELESTGSSSAQAWTLADTAGFASTGPEVDVNWRFKRAHNKRKQLQQQIPANRGVQYVFAPDDGGARADDDGRGHVMDFPARTVHAETPMPTAANEAGDTLPPVEMGEEPAATAQVERVSVARPRSSVSRSPTAKLRSRNRRSS